MSTDVKGARKALSGGKCPDRRSNEREISGEKRCLAGSGDYKEARGTRWKDQQEEEEEEEVEEVRFVTGPSGAVWAA